MSGFLHWTTFALTGLMLLPLIRVAKGPTHFDRLIGLALIGTNTIMLLAAIGSRAGRLDMFIDIALSYALVSFVGTLALARYFERRGRAAR